MFEQNKVLTVCQIYAMKLSREVFLQLGLISPLRFLLEMLNDQFIQDEASEDW